MPSVKGKLLRLGSAFLRRATVASCEDVAVEFRRITLRGDSVRPAPGSKVQLLLPSDDVRTYSPIAAEEPGAFVLLGWKSAGGPGARWVTEVNAGEQLHFAGPQRSLDVAQGPMVIVGDETSVGVAASYARDPLREVHAVFQAGSPQAVRSAAEAVGVPTAQVLPRGDTNGVIRAVLHTLTTLPENTSVTLTGGSELIVAVREGLRAKGVRALKAKAYWIPGKAGLD